MKLNLLRHQLEVPNWNQKTTFRMGDTVESSSTVATSVVSTNAMGNYYPTPNLAHQLPVKRFTSTNFLLWKTQFLPMICGCGLNHYIDIDGSEPAPPRVLDGDKPNPAYKVWVRQDQLAMSGIVASVSESMLPQSVGAETAQIYII
uniref:Retrotransposon Copia-like N-terminal domain-containing protein n=1 Tax=Solanum lycopersicum TaxID=4081 RepID=A0A3Q7ERK6_SOLLC